MEANIVVIDPEDKTFTTIHQSLKLRYEDTGERWHAFHAVKLVDIKELLQIHRFQLALVEQSLVIQEPRKFLVSFKKILGNIPVLITGFETQIEKIKPWLEAGFADYVVKPADRPLLIEKIALLIVGKRDSFKQVYSQIISNRADIAREVIIEDISEFDVLVKTKNNYELGTIVTFFSNLFSENKNTALSVVGRCYKTVPHPIEDGLYQSKFAYLGMNPSALKHLRVNLKKMAENAAFE